MSDFEKFVARHSEAAAQALIENMERYHGVFNQAHKPLSERWVTVMCAPAETQLLAA